MMQGKIFTNVLNEPISDGFMLEVSRISKQQPIKPKTILQRIAASDKTAVNECLKNYGDFVWSLSKKYCKNAVEAETLVQETFLDIWENAVYYDAENSEEKAFIAKLFLRRMFSRRNNL